MAEKIFMGNNFHRKFRKKTKENWPKYRIRKGESVGDRKNAEAGKPWRWPPILARPLCSEIKLASCGTLQSLRFLTSKMRAVCQLLTLLGDHEVIYVKRLSCARYLVNSPGFTEKSQFSYANNERKRWRRLRCLWQVLLICWGGHLDFPWWWPSWGFLLRLTLPVTGSLPVVMVSGTLFQTHSHCSLSLVLAVVYWFAVISNPLVYDAGKILLTC